MKRVAGRSAPEDSGDGGAPAPASTASADDADELQFEDPYEDEEDSEDDDEDGADDDGEGADESRMDEDGAAASAAASSGRAATAATSRAAGTIEQDDDEDDEEDAGAGASVFLPGMHELGEGEELTQDLDAYVMLHSMNVEWPCLSFDVVPDRLGAARTKFPLSATIIGGTQADASSGGDNKLLLMRMNSMYATQGDAGVEDEDEDGFDDDPDLDVQRIPHAGAVNRVRVMPQEPHIVCSMADTGRVHLFDVRPQLRLLDANDGRGVAAPVPRGYGPCFTFAGHAAEGYALDWSCTTPGRIVTGDCASLIHVWDVDASAAAAALSSPGSDLSSVWRVNADAPYSGHSGSVEDLQWSPTEGTVFASASADGSVRIWDTRARRGAMITVHASDVDVNAIAWSKLVSFLLASGDDAGAFKIWDLRKFDRDSVISSFAWHKGQITSIEWAYDDENVLTVASADNTCTLWDMSLEADEEAEMALAKASGTKRPVLPSSRDPTLATLPPQLLFIHGVRSQLKEVHFHKQLPGVMITTAADGFNVFKPDVVVTT